jgi:DNA-binding IclR family transcriptional regulator
MSNSVVRALRILDLLARSEKPLSLSKIVDELDLPKSTAHGIVRSLVQESFVDLHEPTSYAIGLRTFEVGSAYLRQIGPVGVVAAELVTLTRTLNVTSHYALLDGADAVYLCKEDPPGLGVQLASSIGARLPAHLTAVGKACLAWLDDAVITDHVGPLADGETLDEVLEGLRCELSEVRRLGYSTDVGQVAAGVQCVAAPVFDMSRPRGAIGVSYLVGAPLTRDQVVAEVLGAANKASVLLGGKIPQ